jgi:hypothetical protein
MFCNLHGVIKKNNEWFYLCNSKNILEKMEKDGFILEKMEFSIPCTRLSRHEIENSENLLFLPLRS